MLNSLPKWVYITIGSLSLFILTCAVSKCSYELGESRDSACTIKVFNGKVVLDKKDSITSLALESENRVVSNI